MVSKKSALAALRMADKDEVRERFWSKVERSPACWHWVAGKNPAGYGMFRYQGRQRLAHRVAYEFAKGPIPAGLTIDHLCCNKGCVNPDHLEAVTMGVNVKRAPGSVSGINVRKTHCIRGHPLADDNVRVAKRGSRVCRTCERARDVSDYQAEYGRANRDRLREYHRR